MKKLQKMVESDIFEIVDIRSCECCLASLLKNGLLDLGFGWHWYVYDSRVCSIHLPNRWCSFELTFNNLSKPWKRLSWFFSRSWDAIWLSGVTVRQQRLLRSSRFLQLQFLGRSYLPSQLFNSCLSNVPLELIVNVFLSSFFQSRFFLLCVCVCLMSVVISCHLHSLAFIQWA